MFVTGSYSLKPSPVAIQRWLFLSAVIAIIMLLANPLLSLLLFLNVFITDPSYLFSTSCVPIHINPFLSWKKHVTWLSDKPFCSVSWYNTRLSVLDCEQSRRGFTKRRKYINIFFKTRICRLNLQTEFECQTRGFQVISSTFKR